MITIDVADKLGNYDLEAVHYSRPDASADEADLEHVVVQLRALLFAYSPSGFRLRGLLFTNTTYQALC